MRGLAFILTVVIVCICTGDPQVVLSFDTPDTNISGLGYGAGSLWAVDKTTEMVYRLTSWCGKGHSLGTITVIDHYLYAPRPRLGVRGDPNIVHIPDLPPFLPPARWLFPVPGKAVVLGD